jgi:hypothetical protein
MNGGRKSVSLRLEAIACADPLFDSELDSTAVAPTSSSPVRAPVSAVVKTGGLNGVKTGEIAAVLNRC